MIKIGLVLLSGGLDSTIVAAYAKVEGYDLVALSFRYGQRHRREMESAEKVATVLQIRHEIADLSDFRNLAWYSALTAPERFSIPRSSMFKRDIRDIPLTYVPMRNTVFLSLAGALLESRVLSLIENNAVHPNELLVSIFIAVSAVDFSGYPDCRPGYFEIMRQALFEGSKLGKQYGVCMNIETPFLYMTKAEIVEVGLKLKAPVEYTWSCYEGGDVPCGSCDSCRLRARGFAQAGVSDPLLERLRREGKIA